MKVISPTSKINNLLDRNITPPKSFYAGDYRNFIKINEKQGMLDISFYCSKTKKWYLVQCLKEIYMTWEGKHDFCHGTTCCECRVIDFEIQTKLEAENLFDFLAFNCKTKFYKGYLTYMMQKDFVGVFFFTMGAKPPESEHYAYKFNKCVQGIPALSEYRRVNFVVKTLQSMEAQ
jgi:hypothetical protein